MCVNLCKQNVCYTSLKGNSNLIFVGGIYLWIPDIGLVYYAVLLTPQPLTFISTHMHLVHGGIGVSSLGSGCNGNGPKSGYHQTSWPKDGARHIYLHSGGL